MRINDQLNLVLPIRSDDKGVVIQAYHAPISREVFEANYRVLAATKAYLSSKGAHFLMGSGPRIAALTLRDEGRKDALQRGEIDKDGKPKEDAVEAFLLEIKRLTSVFAPGPNGWEVVPIDVAIQRDVIDTEDWREAESALVFFTLQHALATRAEKVELIKATALLMKAACTSSTPMEYLNSLRTSTSSAATEVKVDLSVPS